VIALNTESCYYFNFYLFSTHKDPAEELQWLENLLQEMEEKGEVGILIGHVPSGSDCINNWAYRMNALFERYQHVLRTQLFGHVHQELFSTARAHESKLPVSNQHWSASGTTFTDVNPSFRVVEIDEETMLPVGLQTYFFNITAAKTTEHPDFEFHHDFQKLWELEDLSPKSMLGFAEKLQVDQETALLYSNV